MFRRNNIAHRGYVICRRNIYPGGGGVGGERTLESCRVGAENECEETHTHSAVYIIVIYIYIYV